MPTARVYAGPGHALRDRRFHRSLARSGNHIDDSRNAERGQAWYGWVPTLAREFRIVRPDTRGFGESTAMPRDFKWTIDLIVDDYLSLMKQLGSRSFMSSLQSSAARLLAILRQRCPQQVLSLTVVGTPPPKWDRMGAKAAHSTEELAKIGVEAWARKNMSKRLGSNFPAEGVEWWTRMMVRTATSTMIGFGETIPYTDITDDLPRIKCPTLVLMTEGSALGSVRVNTARGSKPFQTRSCACCPATHIMWRQRMQTAARRRHANLS
jgi:pimeloyl-ACP methyl ester carboxylesterase